MDHSSAESPKEDTLEWITISICYETLDTAPELPSGEEMTSLPPDAAFILQLLFLGTSYLLKGKYENFLIHFNLSYSLFLMKVL